MNIVLNISVYEAHCLFFQSSRHFEDYAVPTFTSPDGFDARMPRGDVPTVEETVPLLQNQAALVQQLEAENKFCRVCEIISLYRYMYFLVLDFQADKLVKCVLSKVDT